MLFCFVLASGDELPPLVSKLRRLGINRSLGIKIVVMSATLTGMKLEEFFHPEKCKCKRIVIQGRRFPLYRFELEASGIAPVLERHFGGGCP